MRHGQGKNKIPILITLHCTGCAKIIFSVRQAKVGS